MKSRYLISTFLVLGLLLTTWAVNAQEGEEEVT